jgi:hypothetical protein
MRELLKFLILAFAIVVSFIFVRACDVQAMPPLPWAQTMQPLPLNGNTECNKVELVAEMQKGKVKLYLVTHCNYFSGTVTVASIDRCYVTVGELHGKTVSTICKFGGRK